MKRLMFVAVALVAAVCDVFADGLPAGYTELPWIESDGKQWIVTDYSLHLNDAKSRVDEKVETKIQVRTMTNWGYDVVFGAFGLDAATTGNPGYNDGCFALSLFDTNGSDTNAEIYAYTANWPNKTTKTNQITVDGVDRILAFDGKTNTHYLDGVAKSTQAGTYRDLSPLCIFGGKMPGSNVSTEALPDDGTGGTKSRISYIRMYYLKVYNGSGDLVFDLVPARDDNASVITKRYGLYDRYHNVFYPNNGSKAFLIPEGYGFVYTIDRADYATDAEAGAALVALAGDATKLVAGDTIRIVGGTAASPKVYAVSEPVVLAVAGVKIEGTGSDRNAAVIDAGGTSAGVVLDAADTSLSGVTIRNAGTAYVSGSTYYAAGLTLKGTGSVASNCVVRDSIAWGAEKELHGGGVLLCPDSAMYDSLVANCCVSNEHVSTGKTAFYGGGVCMSERTKLIGTEVRGCRLWNGQHSANKYDTGSGYGAGVATFRWKSVSPWPAGNIAVISNCWIHANETVKDSGVANASSYTSFGAGISIYNLATPIRDTVIEANTNFCGGGGIYCFGTLDVANCSIVSNVCGLAGNIQAAGGGVSGHGTIVNTLIEGNQDLSDTSWSSGGGAMEFYGDLLDCVVRGNSRPGMPALGHGLIHRVTDALTISNCVFDANGTITSPTAAIMIRIGKNVTIRDCWFTGNRNKKGVVSGVYPGSAISVSSGSGFKVINCFFANNGDAADGPVIGGDWTAVTSSGELENCTFVNNASTAAPVINFGTSAAPLSLFKMRGCLFSGNAKKALADNYATASTNNIYGCYDDDGKSWFPADTEHDYGNLCAADLGGLSKYVPGFTDAANGDYSLRRSSKLKDRLTVRSDSWESADGCQDLGNGKWTETAVSTLTFDGVTRNAGVVVTRCDPRPRVVNGMMNIGCSEGERLTGVVVIFR